MNKHSLFLSVCTALCIASGDAAVTSETFTFSGINLNLPDGNPTGMVSFQSLTSTITSIHSLVVTLDVSGTYNGDLYVYIQHDSGFSVLLNRTGRDAGDAFGYDDDGFKVTFDDLAPGDIHTYRNAGVTLPGNPVIGTWQPDARSADPDLVTTASLRDSKLSNFNGLDASGGWTLFAADLSTGDQHVVQGFSLTIVGEAVPEPGSALLLGMGCLLITRRRRA